VTEKYFANHAAARATLWTGEAGFGHLDFLGGFPIQAMYFYKLGSGYRDEVPEG
jgi:hypothetical protein